MKKELSVKFGNKVRKIRKKKGLSQEELANLADVHRTYVGMIERAEKNITLESAKKIAHALGINMEELLKGI